jgi:serine/threonine protein kinase
MVGTPYYMSPEQAQGNKAVDYRSDLWALGVITFEMLTGTKPFDSDALGDLILSICVRELPVPSQFGPVPAGFDAWFAHAVARDPNHRFQSARELALALLKLVENADGDIRNTRLDEPRLSLNPDNSRPALSPNEAAPIAEIPSRPINKAFAATVRDDTLARSPSDTTPLSPALSIEFGSTEEERLAPWALAGMALLALAAGAAVVYGLFHLLRDPNVNDANHAANPSASYESVTPNRPTRFAKRKSDVAASNRPNPSQGTSKSPETTNNAPIATKRDVEDANVTTEAHTTPAAATSVTLPRSHVEPTEPLKNDSPRNDTAPFRDAKPLTQSTTEPFATNIAEPSAHPTQLPTLVEPSSSVTYPIDALPMVTDQSN